MGWYLLDSPNPHGRFYHPSRQPCRHGIAPTRLPHLVVWHTAETLPDYTGPDTAAEAVARYASTTSRRVSWHYTIDSDTTIPMLPWDHTAWHVRGFNTCSIGVEVATSHDRWATAPKRWLDGVITQARKIVTNVHVDHHIDPVQLRGPDPGTARGHIGHQDLDPTRRRDPGPGFPWQQILNLASDSDPHQLLTRGARGLAVQRLQETLLAIDPTLLPRWGADGVYGAETGSAVVSVQQRLGLDATGVVDGLTWAAFQVEAWHRRR